MRPWPPLPCFCALPGAQARQVTDLAGRVVTVPDHPKRVLLGEGRFVFAMALLDRKDPVARVVGWQGELKQQDPYSWTQLVKRYPKAADVPLIGKTSEASVSPEKIVSLQPDVAVFSLSGHGPGRNNPMIAALQAAGIPIVFIDFRQHPVENTVPSMRILGQALDRQAEADAYIAFYEDHLARVRKIVDPVPQAQRPRVFVEMLAGVWPACSHTTGNGSFGDLLETAGGVNVAARCSRAPLATSAWNSSWTPNPTSISPPAAVPNRAAPGCWWAPVPPPRYRRTACPPCLAATASATWTP